MTLTGLSNEQLLSELHALVGKGRVLLARLLAYLAEVEDRRLDLESACSSPFDFCVRRLAMSEDEAWRRVAAARLTRRFPLALEMIEQGKIHLTGVLLLRDYLTDENHEELLVAAAGKTKAEVQELVRARFPRSDAPSLIEPEAPALPLPGPLATPAPATATTRPLARHAIIEPLSPERYRVQFTASAALRDKITHAKNLLAHQVPNGDLATILERALDVLLEKLEKQRLGKTKRVSNRSDTAASTAGTATSRSGTAASTAGTATNRSGTADTAANPSGTAVWPRRRRGHIPTAERRAVFERDGAQCTFVDEVGRRCPARAFLELDHLTPHALGGADDAANLTVRCRRHNALAAERVFGRDHIEKRKAERRKCSLQRDDDATHARTSQEQERALPRRHDDATAGRALRGLGFKDREVRRALSTLEELWAGSRPSLETIVREALRILT